MRIENDDPPLSPTLSRRLAAEWLGTALLLTAVVGSGIMAQKLSGGNSALALLANSLATGAALFAIIVLLAPLSGAHLNPIVTGVLATRGALPWREAGLYGASQTAGAFMGTAIANLMFDLPAFSTSTTVRTGAGQFLGECVAAFGLLFVVLGTLRRNPPLIAALVGCYITAAYWFTSSTSFANPAVTLARAATDTFAGIRPADVPAFLVAQALGAALAVAFCGWMFKETDAGKEVA